MLKLRQMGTSGLQMKGVIPWLVPWTHRTHRKKRDFYPALEVLVGPIQKKNFLAAHLSLFAVFVVDYFPI